MRLDHRCCGDAEENLSAAEPAWPAAGRANVSRHSPAPIRPKRQPQQAMSQRMGTIYPGAPGATGRQARARSLAEHATSNTTEEANDRCRTPDDSTAEDEHSDHNRTTPAIRQAPAWAPFTFQGLSCQLSNTVHGRFVEARPARPTSTRLSSCRAHQSTSGGSIVAQTKRDTVPRGVPARCRTGRLEEPWHAQPNAPRPRAAKAATSG